MKNSKLFIILTMLLFLLASCQEKETKSEEKSTNDGKDAVTQKEVSKDPSPKELGEAYGLLFAYSTKDSGLDIDINAFVRNYKKIIKLDELDPQAFADAELLLKNAFSIAQKKQMAKEEEKSEKNKKLGKDFLTTNGEKSGVITTGSGLQYEVIQEGSGDKPLLGDTVEINYVGTLIDGSEFDNSSKHNDGEPIKLVLKDIIPAWLEAMPLMKAGSIYKLYIPSDLGYGDRSMKDQSGKEVIPAGSTLIFEIELLNVTHSQNKAE